MCWKQERKRSRGQKLKKSLITQVQKMRPRVVKSSAQDHKAMAMCMHRGLDLLYFVTEIRLKNICLFCEVSFRRKC